MPVRNGPAQSISLFVISDVRIYREGIASSLDQLPDFTVVGQGDSFAPIDAVVAADPDVTVIDVTCRDSAALVRSISERAASMKIIVFGVDESPEDILGYAESGASGYVQRQASMSDLVAIIMSAVRGELICSPRMAALLFRRLGSRGVDRRAPDSPAELTGRERQIFGMLREGLANKEIAHRLNIAEATVKNHVHNLLGKLHLTRRSEALTAAMSPLASRARKASGILGA
jgi:DNA-binding NarL/FixJ family response regulator